MNPTTFIRNSLIWGSAALLGSASAMAGEAAKTPVQKKNILLIIVDDLRPQLGCYGNQLAKTPNIDRLASEGTRFNRAFCNYPVCGPSRASLFSGMRPTQYRFLGNEADVQTEYPEVKTMNTWFRNQGYATAAMGKVYHNRKDNEDGWSDGAWGPGDNDPKKKITGWRDYLSPENQELCRQSPQKVGYAFEMVDVPDNAYYDGKVAERGMQFLERYKNNGTPFFMTLGFVKPHLPFNAPKKYWDLYPEDEIHLPSNYFFPENAPGQAEFNFPELRAYFGIPKKGPIPGEMAKKLIRGYYAGASYSDAQVGLVLDKLKELGLDKTTSVILIGDHGWHLGEHTLWAKHSNFFNTLNTTMIVRAPGTTAGNVVQQPTELVDVYPTVCELAGIGKPGQLEGQSMVPLLDKAETDWKKEVYSKFENAFSVGTERYVYTEWWDEQGAVLAHMLYDHKTDKTENRNVADDPAYRKQVIRFGKMLKKAYPQNDKLIRQSSGTKVKPDE